MYPYVLNTVYSETTTEFIMLLKRFLLRSVIGIHFEKVLKTPKFLLFT